MLGHVLKKDRAFLYREMDKELDDENKRLFFQLIKKRQKGKPIAYITKEREFWSRKFIINESV